MTYSEAIVDKIMLVGRMSGLSVREMSQAWPRRGLHHACMRVCDLLSQDRRHGSGLHGGPPTIANSCNSPRRSAVCPGVWPCQSAIAHCSPNSTSHLLQASALATRATMPTQCAHILKQCRYDHILARKFGSAVVQRGAPGGETGPSDTTPASHAHRNWQHAVP